MLPFLFHPGSLFGQSALALNGSGQYMSAGPGWETGANDFTIEGWFMRTGTGKYTRLGGQELIPLITRGRDGDPQSEGVNYMLGVDVNGRIVAGFGEAYNSANPGRIYVLQSDQQMDQGAWYHLAYTVHKEGTDLEAYLSINGETVATGDYPGVTIFSTGHFRYAAGTSLDEGGNPDGFFQGKIDELRLWKYARNDWEIRGMMAYNAAYETGIKARWSFDEAAGGIAYNFSKDLLGDHHRLDGTVHGGASRVPGTDFQPKGMRMPRADAGTMESSTVCLADRVRMLLPVTDPENDSLAVRFFGRKKRQSPRKPFTIIGVPDTQLYTQNKDGNEMRHFYRQMEWVRKAKDSLNIVFVAHLGDCVENGDEEEVEWLRADTAMHELELPEQFMPYGIAVGNHDQTVWTQPGLAIKYNEYFGEERFRGRNYYGGHFGPDNNNNHFQLFSGGDIDFIAISMEFDYAPDMAVLDWADSLIAAYPNRKAIVYSHFHLEGKGYFSSQGAATYKRLRKHSNFFLMLAGHVPAPLAHRTDYYMGNPVHNILSDFQNFAEGGMGYLNILTFYPDEKLIRVSTYSPSLGSWRTGPEAEFELPFEADWTFLGSKKVASGTTATHDWRGLDEGQTYEWYATVSDSSHSIRSKEQSFYLPTVEQVYRAEVVPNCGGDLSFVVAGFDSYQTFVQGAARTELRLEGEGMHTFLELGSEGCLIEKNVLIVAGNCGDPGLVAFPNPATNQVRITWPERNWAEEGEIMVWNLQGLIVQQSPIPPESGFLDIETDQWTPGSYLLELRFSGNTYRRRFVVY